MDTKRMSAITRTKGKERGQALIFVLLCLTCLLGFIGLATDVGTWLNAKRRIQTAADSAAIAGAAELNYGDVTAAAKADSATNGLTDGTNGTIVTVNNPPSNGPNRNNAKYVEVIVSQSEPTFFSKLFNLNAVTVRARAVAFLTNGQSCINMLGTTMTDIRLNGGVDLEAPQCGITANSSDGAALLANGSVTVNAKWIGVVGNFQQNGAGTLTPTPQAGIVPVTDPIALLSPPATGTCSQTLSAGGNATVSWNPGNYCGISIQANSTVTFAPGIYTVSGGSFTITGSPTVSGTGVTFYLTNGASLTISGSASLTLEAPTSGMYNSILFFQDRSDAAAVTIKGNSSSVLQGIIYFPAAPLTFDGGSSNQLYLDLIANDVTFNGAVHLQDYALINRTSPIVATALAE